MNELVDNLKGLFADAEARRGYSEAFTNSYVAAQIKANRESRELKQEDLAVLIGTKQSGISRLENANYSGWKVETLHKLAQAFGLHLRISFEEFGSLVGDVQNFKKETLIRRPFGDDPVFNERVESASEEIAASPIKPQDILLKYLYDWLKPADDIKLKDMRRDLRSEGTKPQDQMIDNTLNPPTEASKQMRRFA